MKTPKTLKEIQNHPLVDKVDREHDGAFGEYDNPRGNLWVYLKPGYKSVEMETGIIHEPTVKDVIAVFKSGIIKS